MAAAIIAIIAGSIETFLGRRLFWLFVAIGGFLLGWLLVPGFFPGAPDWLLVIIGVVVGIAFAFLAVPFTRGMVTIAGFLVFAGAAVLFLRFLGAGLAEGTAWFWVVYVLGGLVGAVLLFLYLDRALVVLTALAGAWGVAGGIGTLVEGDPRWLQALIFVILAAVGIAVQWLDLKAHPDLLRTRPGRPAQ